MPLLISIVSFIVIMLILLMWYNDYMADKMKVAERKEKYLEDKPDTDSMLRTQHLTAVPSDKFWRKSVTRLGEPFESTTWAQKIEHKLVQADLPFRGSEFIIICIGVMLLTGLLFLLLSGGNKVMIILGLIIGYIVCALFVHRRIARRIKSFNAQLADALVLIASSLRSGYSFMQAIEMVSKEMQQPMSVEFFRVLREINLGVTTDSAMNHMAERINSEDLDLVVTAVLIQRQVGGNLAEILDNIAHTIRERVKIKGHIMTLTAQGRMSGIIIGLIPIFLCGVIFLINPGYITPLFTEPVGHVMLITAVFIEAIGMFFIRKIVNIRI